MKSNTEILGNFLSTAIESALKTAEEDINRHIVDEKQLKELDVTNLMSGVIYGVKNKGVYMLNKNIEQGDIPTNLTNCFWICMNAEWANIFPED